MVSWLALENQSIGDTDCFMEKCTRIQDDIKIRAASFNKQGNDYSMEVIQY